MLTLVTGKEIDERYVIDTPIGTGGFATVWKASDKQLNRPVALKRLLKQGGTSPIEHADQLLAEARKHAQLVHTNIVQVYDVIESDGEHLIVMEYVDGGSLQTVLRDQAKGGQVLPMDKAVSILGDVLAGVAFAHEKRIIHRDLSPSNILLTSTGIPKIGDFGIAQVDEPSGSSGPASTHGGTGNRYYMSPEQHRGEKADTSSDLFTVGIIGYLLLTGRHPFAHPSGLFTIPEFIGDDNYMPELPRPPTGLTTSQQRLFREYAAVVMRLLNRERAGRFSTARAAFDALEAVTPFQECPHCGERIPEYHKFCGYCRGDLSVSQPPPTEVPKAEIPAERSAVDLVEEGFSLSQLRRWEEAVLRYEQAIKIDPSYQKAFRNLGYALIRLGRFEEAERALSQGQELGAEVPSHEASILHERALARAEMKNYDGALEDVNRALLLLPFSVRSLYLRSRIFLFRGQTAEAKRDAQEVLRRVPDHAGALRLIDQIQ